MKRIAMAGFAAVCAAWVMAGCQNINSPEDVLLAPIDWLNDVMGNSTECEVCGKRIVVHTDYGEKMILPAKRCNKHSDLTRKCPNCSTWIHPSADLCSACSEKRQPSTQSTIEWQCSQCSNPIRQRVGLCSTCIAKIQRSFQSTLESLVATNNLILAQILSQVDHDKLKALYRDDDSSQKTSAVVDFFLQCPTNRSNYIYYFRPNQSFQWTRDEKQPRFCVNQEAIYNDVVLNKLNDPDTRKKEAQKAENMMNAVICRAQAVIDFIRADDEEKAERTRRFQSGDVNFKFANAALKDQSIPLYKDIVSGVTKEWCREWIKSKNLESAKRNYGLAIDDGGNILNLYFEGNALSEITIILDQPMTVEAITNRVRKLYGDKVQVSHRGGTAIEPDLDHSIETMWLFVKRHKYVLTDSETVSINFDENDLVGLTYYASEKISEYKLFWNQSEQMRLAKWQNGYEDAVVTADGKISYPRGSGFDNIPEPMRTELSEKLVEAMRISEENQGLGRVRTFTVRALKTAPTLPQR